MSLYKRKETWWITISHQGRRIQQTTGTTDKALAQRYHDEFKAKLYRMDNFGEKPAYTWNDAVIKWLKETSDNKDSRMVKSRLRWLHNYLNGNVLTSINEDVISYIADAKRDEGAGTATINRHLAIVRAILRKAALEWKWIDKAPTIKLKAENNERKNYLTPMQIEQLKRELPPHLADAVELSVHTGLRASNVAQLEWSEVDFTRGYAFIPAHKTKPGKDLCVPLNSNAIAVIRKRIGKHDKYVFTYRGRPVDRFNNSAWRKALKRLGLTDFKWHDLRHTWASWHIMNGTSLYELQQLGGWSSYEMVQRYSHLSNDHLKAAANRVTNLLHGDLKLVENV